LIRSPLIRKFLQKINRRSTPINADQARTSWIFSSSPSPLPPL
jgi:hypothetical protein